MLNIAPCRVAQIKKLDRVKRYSSDFIVTKMVKRFKLTSVYCVPAILKIVLSMRTGKLKSEKNASDLMLHHARCISGQVPLITRAAKAIANFKVKKNDAVGLKVTLRQRRMYEFMDRFTNLSLPRVRDFRGIPSQSIDQGCNLNIGLAELSIFHEISYSKFSSENGLNVCIVTSGRCKELTSHTLKAFGLPLKLEVQNV